MAESAYARRKRMKKEREMIESALAVERKPIKVKRKRKPMTEEQKAAAAERLAKAREKKRAEQGDIVPKNVHPSIVALPDEHALSLKNTREAIKEVKSQLTSARQSLKSKIKGAQTEVNILEHYKASLERYIQTGDYTHDRYGKNMEGKMKRVCVALAYHHEGPRKGQPKRDVGVFYPDLGCEWTQEMNLEYYGITETKTYSKTRKTTARRAPRRAKRKS